MVAISRLGLQFYSGVRTPHVSYVRKVFGNVLQLQKHNKSIMRSLYGLFCSDQFY